MDAILAARELGKAIQADPRYTRIMKAQDINDSDTVLQEAIAAFNLKRNQLNAEVQKEDKDAELIKEMDTELKAMYAEIFENKNMREFSDARTDMEEMLTFINQIVSGSATGENPDTIEMQHECGGECGGCSGCH